MIPRLPDLPKSGKLSANDQLPNIGSEQSKESTNVIKNPYYDDDLRTSSFNLDDLGGAFDDGPETCVSNVVDESMIQALNNSVNGENSGYYGGQSQEASMGVGASCVPKPPAVAMASSQPTLGGVYPGVSVPPARPKSGPMSLPNRQESGQYPLTSRPDSGPMSLPKLPDSGPMSLPKLPDSGSHPLTSRPDSGAHPISSVPGLAPCSDGMQLAVNYSGYGEQASELQTEAQPALNAFDESGEEKPTEQYTAPSYLLPEVGGQFDKFAVEQQLGVGGFGAVYRVKNLSLGREEALKVILPEVANEGNNDKRFIREVDVISRIEHPNVVRLYNFGTNEKGVKWMSMELLRGMRLDKLIHKHGVLSFDESKQIMVQLLYGLQEAHAHNLIHRDLKPSNIMLSEKEGYGALVKILDFGLAKALGKEENLEVQALTQVAPKCIFGTPQYIAPEQLQPHVETGPWSDVYASALLFIEMMTGKQAVMADSLVEVAFKQLNADVSMPHAWEGRAIGAVMHKALAKDIANRYQNAGEFLEALQKVNAVDDPVEVLDKPLPEQRVGLCGVYLPQRQASPVQEVVAPAPAPQRISALYKVCTVGFFALLIIVLIFIIVMVLGSKGLNLGL